MPNLDLPPIKGVDSDFIGSKTSAKLQEMIRSGPKAHEVNYMVSRFEEEELRFAIHKAFQHNPFRRKLFYAKHFPKMKRKLFFKVLVCALIFTLFLCALFL